jgi:hypothetical protein
MEVSMFGLLSRLSPVAKKSRKQSRVRPLLEALEDRLVPAGWDYTNLVQSLPGYTHAGPTHLYLNFDGKDNITPYFNKSPAQTNQDIAEILFRTSEVYAPFNVEVSRLWGKGNYDSSDKGSTTIFIGWDPNNTNDKGKFVNSYTPAQNADFPGWAKGFAHRPNSDDHDIAYVDPFSTDFSAKNPAAFFQVQSPATTVQEIVHEAGHTFGLCHVRTDTIGGKPGGTILTDPFPLPVQQPYSKGTVKDVMSYSDDNNFFANQAFPTTGWNFAGGTQYQLDRLGQIPKWASSGAPWDSDDIVTQNSFTYLQTVLGPRPAEAGYRAVNPGSLDPSVQKQFIPQADTLGQDIHLSTTGSISHYGDYDVNRWTSSRNQVLKLTLTTAYGLSPVLEVFDSKDNLISTFFGQGTYKLPVTVRSTYYFVVGGQGGSTTGAYTLNVDQEQHTFWVATNSLTEHLQGTPEQLATITTSAVVSIGGLNGLHWGDTTTYRTLQVTFNQGEVPIHIDIVRNAKPKVIQGTVKLISGEWYVDYHDGTGWHDTGLDSRHSKQQVQKMSVKYIAPPPGTKLGVVRSIDLTYDLAKQTITGKTDEWQSATGTYKSVSGTPGLPITVLGGDSLPDITFTVSMDSPPSHFFQNGFGQGFNDLIRNVFSLHLGSGSAQTRSELLAQVFSAVPTFFSAPPPVREQLASLLLVAEGKPDTPADRVGTWHDEWDAGFADATTQRAKRQPHLPRQGANDAGTGEGLDSWFDAVWEDFAEASSRS